MNFEKLLAQIEHNKILKETGGLTSMGSNKFNRMTIPVSKIDLDLRNPRFGRASSQIDAIAKIIGKNRVV